MSRRLVFVYENDADLFLRRLSENQIIMENLELDEDVSNQRDIIISKIIEAKALYIEWFLGMDIASCAE